VRDGLWMPSVRLDRANTFGLPAEAEFVCRPKHLDELRTVVAEAQKRGLEWWVMGGGSNLLLGPQIGGVCLMPAITGIKVVVETEDDVTLDVGAGVNWHELVRFAVGQGWSGIENLALIPGTVGAAPIQNIGAYGVEIAESTVGVHVLRCADLGQELLPAEACGFSYRSSVFKTTAKGRYLITGLRLCLSRRFVARDDYPDVAQELRRMGLAQPVHPAQVAEAVTRVRRRKLPDWRRFGNAGSFFQNPVVSTEHFARLQRDIPDLAGYPAAKGYKVSAARLIDLAGWKGRREGAILVWPRQPLVLVNTGGGTASQVLTLAERIVNDVVRRFAVQLVPEVQLVGISHAISAESSAQDRQG
jgi:UDP-N-acetylmuramate dehydrogenase